VRYLAGRIEALPAGANNAGWVVVIILVVAIWWFATKR